VSGNGGIAPPFLTLALDGGERSASCLHHFIAGEIAPCYLLDRRLGGYQGRSGRWSCEKYFASAGNRTSGRPTRSMTQYGLNNQFKYNFIFNLVLN
jgi:hypothetical protein